MEKIVLSRKELYDLVWSKQKADRHDPINKRRLHIRNPRFTLL
jgi:hypothetical protein